MSYRGTPYYDMARDAGYRGEEAEQMAAAIEEAERRRESQRQLEREAEERAQQELSAIDGETEDKGNG